MIAPLHVSGKPRDRGRQHGEQAREPIRSNLEIYRRWFEDFGGVAWERVLEECPKFLAVFDQEIPELAEEVRGIAEGAGQTVNEIVALNARTEIAYGVSGILNASECTALGVTADASADGHVYVAENWDWLPETLPNTLLLHIDVGRGHQILTFTEAGMLAKFGVNSAGIGLCNNLLASNQNQLGQTFHSLARAVLESRSLLEALTVVTSATRAGSGNFMIGSAAGEVIDLEWAPTDYHVFYADEGYLAHSNHFLASLYNLRDGVKIRKDASPGTFLRLARANKLLKTRRGQLDGQMLADILRDHQGMPEAICRHRDTSPLEVFGQSNVSAVFDLTAQTVYYTEGPPCEGEYKAHPFPWSERPSRQAAPARVKL